jgi:hypothetical protein
VDAFTARLGTTQGRVERASGDVVFVLGDVEPGRTAALTPGDYVEAAQVADLTGASLLRAAGALRAPFVGHWRLSLRLDGQEVAAVDAWPGRTRAISDLAANVAGRKGPTDVSLRLTFVGR